MSSSSSLSDMSRRSSISRPRKSTLTQQQKNKKRQRATPAQLLLLKSEFQKNSTPNAKTREEIGKRIDMTERSVQIWFQNKRAKAKQFARKHGSSMVNGYYPGMSSPLDSDDSSCSDVLFTSPFNTPSLSLNGTTMGSTPASPLSQSARSVVLPCSSLSIGSWKRISSSGTTADDLTVVFSPSESNISYTMFTKNTGFKIEYPLACIESVRLSPQANQMAGDVLITLSQSPLFSIQTENFPGIWLTCDDFSEQTQASTVRTHRLAGPYNQLRRGLVELYARIPNKVTGVISTGLQSMNGSTVGFRTPFRASVSGAAMVQAGLGNSMNSNTNSLFPIQEVIRSKSVPSVISVDTIVPDANSFLSATDFTNSELITPMFFTQPGMQQSSSNTSDISFGNSDSMNSSGSSLCSPRALDAVDSNLAYFSLKLEESSSIYDVDSEMFQFDQSDLLDQDKLLMTAPVSLPDDFSMGSFNDNFDDGALENYTYGNSLTTLIQA